MSRRFDCGGTQDRIQEGEERVTPAAEGAIHLIAEGSQRFPFGGVHTPKHARASLLLSTRLHSHPAVTKKASLGARVNPKVVSEMLGHSAISITLDIYAHVLPDMQQDAATTMQRLLFS